MEDKKLRKDLFILGLFFLVLCLLNFFLAYSERRFSALVWFCYATLLVFTAGLLTGNLFLVSTGLTSSFFIAFIWTQDYVSFLLFKHLTIGIADYLTTASSIRLVSTVYHLFMLVFPPWVIFRIGKIHRKSWLGAAGLLAGVSLVTLYLLGAPFNCVQGTCNLGVFSPMKKIYSSLTPPFVINVLVMTLVIFIPTQIFFEKIIKWIKK